MTIASQVHPKVQVAGGGKGLSSLVSLVLLSYALKRVGPTPTEIYGALEPPTAVLVGCLVFSEPFSLRVTELRYLGYGNPLVENHFRVTLANGRAFNIVTDKTHFPIKYGATLVSIKAENKDHVLCFDKRAGGDTSKDDGRR